MVVARAVGESDTPSVLAVVIDCNPLEWATRADEELPALLEQLLIFANAFWMLSSANRLVLIGAHPAAARQLWPETPERAAEPAPPHRLRRALARGVDELLALDTFDLPSDGRALLAPALSLATLRIQRARRDQPMLQPRVLVVHASADEPSEHLRLVDLAFANQKLDVRERKMALPFLLPMAAFARPARLESSSLLREAAALPEPPFCDGCLPPPGPGASPSPSFPLLPLLPSPTQILSDSVLLHPRPPSLALQQLSHLTGGLHLHADTQATAALGVYLVAAVLPDQFTRRCARTRPHSCLPPGFFTPFRCLRPPGASSCNVHADVRRASSSHPRLLPGVCARSRCLRHPECQLK